MVPTTSISTALWENTYCFLPLLSGLAWDATDVILIESATPISSCWSWTDVVVVLKVELPPVKFTSVLNTTNPFLSTFIISLEFSESTFLFRTKESLWESYLNCAQVIGVPSAFLPP